ncbi:hypothetical protein KC19_10G110400 [Ceratodon purpureus]|uniref:Uncharacterized protein n=1 Tax=Ceratodon purpureus TaxID=3225 RepID=A0A8T0GLU6_CERPU|nr:hypothetical protein KC19_10G110400 [Ceratodon purpureus]
MGSGVLSLLQHYVVVLVVLLFFSVSPITCQQSRTQTYETSDCKFFSQDSCHVILCT